ncbi:LCP family protein [Streptomyces sp. SID3212]|uniref:LCP family protein n=1 Tax=Streptomyces sp. SID3212 TaxID=2690259 RepID=UPI0013696666|nr:LCP family protein [Streptomyces sp. SID3212]MYV51444.1 LytR family transcriptional regulator [Streptomyces sp. SID3212]
MDADVTDSAGTPAEPDNPAEDEPQGGAPGLDKSATASPPPDAGTPTEPVTTEAGAKAEADADAEADAEAEAEAVAEADKDADADNVTDDATDGGTDSGTAPQAAAPADNDAATEPGHPRPRRHWLRWTAIGTSVVLLGVSAAGWWFYRKLDGNITTDTTAATELRTYEKERPVPVATDATNILMIGSDSRAGDNDKYGRDDGGSQRSDTVILLHLAANRESATAVSVPRDLMADIPSCREADGSRSRAQFAQFNSAFELGGAACTIRTVEKLTGIRIDHHMVIDFSGFKDMVNAVDGVEVCLAEPVDDVDAHLKLPEGRQKLNGEQALGFVRSRHGIGDGSDTQRMDRQQRFLGALFKKVQSNGVLLNPTRLYPVLDAATKSVTTDPGLNSLKDLYDLARSMRDVPTEKVQFLTAPRQPYSGNRNRDELVQPEADKLFKALREDSPISVEAKDDGDTGVVADSDGESSTATPSERPTESPDESPTFSGTNAAVGMCG